MVQEGTESMAVPSTLIRRTEAFFSVLTAIKSAPVILGIFDLSLETEGGIATTLPTRLGTVERSRPLRRPRRVG